MAYLKIKNKTTNKPPSQARERERERGIRKLLFQPKQVLSISRYFLITRDYSCAIKKCFDVFAPNKEDRKAYF